MALTRAHHDPFGGSEADEYCTGQFPEGCGAKVVEYQHQLNKPLIRALLVLYRAAGGSAQKTLHLEQELHLNRSEDRNFPKLRYFDLVAKSFNADGLRIQGCWNLTETGVAFVKGDRWCYPRVWTWRGDPVEFEGEPVEISQVIDIPAWLAEDYAAHARPRDFEEAGDG